MSADTPEHHDTVEREVKLDVDDDFVLPDLVPGPAGALRVDVMEPADLDATYWDTADLALLDQGITVRRRSGEGTRWTVKFPTSLRAAAGGIARREVELRDEAVDPPERVVELVHEHAGGAALAPVARLVSHRERLALVGPDGASVAEIDDDRVVAEVGDSVGRFREVEVEFGTRVDDEVVEEVVARLRGAGARPASGRSKIERAVELLGLRGRP